MVPEGSPFWPVVPYSQDPRLPMAYSIRAIACWCMLRVKDIPLIGLGARYPHHISSSARLRFAPEKPAARVRALLDDI